MMALFWGCVGGDTTTAMWSAGIDHKVGEYPKVRALQGQADCDMVPELGVVVQAYSLC